MFIFSESLNFFFEVAFCLYYVYCIHFYSDPDPDRHQHVEAEVEVLDGRTGKDQGVGREGQGQEVVNVVVVVIVGTEIDMEDTKLWKKFTQNILHI